MILRPAVAPNLPITPEEYDKHFQNQMANALRLYFKQIDGNSQSLLGRQGGMYLNMPFGTFQDNTTQTAAVINTAYPITFDTTDASNSVSIVSNSRVTVTYPGYYNFQFSMQLTKTGGASIEFVYIWARVNGTDIPDSATRIAIQGANADTVAAWNFVLPMNAGDYFQLMWSVTNTLIEVLHVPTVAPAPGIPSVILTATFVSNIPE